MAAQLGAGTDRVLAALARGGSAPKSLAGLRAADREIEGAHLIGRLAGVVLLGSLFVIGYTLVNGIDGVYRVGGDSGFLVTGARALAGASVALVGSIVLLLGLGGVTVSPTAVVLGGGLIIVGVVFGLTGDLRSRAVESAPRTDASLAADRRACEEFSAFLSEAETLAPTPENAELLRSRLLALDSADATPSVAASIDAIHAAIVLGDGLDEGIRDLARACDARFPGGAHG